MCTKKTNEEFLLQAIAKHGNNYDYTKTEYINALTKVIVTCREHGDFLIKPNNHLKGDGCPICRYRKIKHKVCGFGINDLDDITTNDCAYHLWRDIIKRCYDEKTLIRRPQYNGCSVCEEWRHFSNFKKWFEEKYIVGFAIDKDILVKGNKVYSPETCCFVPTVINTAFATLKSRQESLPLGVHYSKRLKKYKAEISKDRQKFYLGLFDNMQDAFQVYKVEKEKHLKELADRYKDVIEDKVYNTLYSYEVSIND